MDAAKLGWVGIADRDGFDGAYLAPTIGELMAVVEADGPVAVIGIDIPIGLSDTSVRVSDGLAKGRLGRLRSSLFEMPIRTALQAHTYSEALEINRRVTGRGMSIQSYGLRHTVFEVDDWLRVTGRTAHEVHPELSFATIAGRPLTASKRTWSGMNQRRQLLAAAGIVIADELGAAGSAGVDDVLDAAAVAWTARRIARGAALSLPEQPERFSDGHAAAIWC